MLVLLEHNYEKNLPCFSQLVFLCNSFCFAGNINIINLLLQANTDINAKTNTGKTALMINSSEERQIL